MEDINLTDMSLDELKALHSKVRRAIDTFEDRRKKEAQAVVEAKAREMGFSITDLYATSKKSAQTARPAKFRHPENPELTWSGRGRKPSWFKNAIEAGADADDFLITT